MPATRNAHAHPNGAVAAEAKPGATVAKMLLDAADKVDAPITRSGELERENSEPRHELASTRTRADDVHLEALAAGGPRAGRAR